MSAKKARFETFFRCSWNRCSTRAKCKRSSGSIWDGISIVYLGSYLFFFSRRVGDRCFGSDQIIFGYARAEDVRKVGGIQRIRYETKRNGEEGES